VVRRVDVSRDWPRTVTIVVRERTPAAVQQRGPAFVLVDRSGVAFDQVDRRPRGLPLVSAPVDAGAPALRAALDVLDDLPGRLRGEVRQVRAGSPDRVQVLLTHGRTVVWGSAERGERKAAVLAVLLDRKASVYDVSAPDAPTTRR
jgi:cell division protein FtsQ